MGKQPVEEAWFNSLSASHSYLEWLSQPQLKAAVHAIVDFGCNSSEFLALLWYLDAAEVIVVQIDEEHLSKPREQLRVVERTNPAALDGRSVSCIVEDMSNLSEEQIGSDSCDLAYCRNVLYFVWDNRARFQESVNQMARVVRPGGWVIACESNIRAEHWDGHPVGDRIDIGQHFLAAGLEPVTLVGAPDCCNSYKKPRRPSDPSMEATVLSGSLRVREARQSPA